MLLNKLSINESASLEVFHGGSAKKGKLVTYYTTSKEMAQSYAEMYNDRFGHGGEVHRSIITIRNPAPEKVIYHTAKQVGIDNDYYTPASVFDTNLHDNWQVSKLVKSLKRSGYDGAVLNDIGYGTQIHEQVYIIFT
ncbi:MAG: hypothetical protein M0R50_09900 [Candidatus Cloacimonetes bacterium]|jgi:hypothetical protein|nr:hypothetical protein [Candidatus Cloacimonadota bacterium]